MSKGIDAACKAAGTKGYHQQECAARKQQGYCFHPLSMSLAAEIAGPGRLHLLTAFAGLIKFQANAWTAGSVCL